MACARWYYVQTRFVDAVKLQCPVCGADPERLENRARPPDVGPAWWDQLLGRGEPDRVGSASSVGAG